MTALTRIPKVSPCTKACAGSAPLRAAVDEMAMHLALAIDNARLYQLAQDAVTKHERFIAVASHELRTPVTNINGYADLLRRTIDRPEIDRERLVGNVERLTAATRKLIRLTENLLDVSRLQKGAFAIAPARMNLSELLASVVETVRMQRCNQPVIQLQEWLAAGLQHFVLRLAHPFDTGALARLIKLRDA